VTSGKRRDSKLKRIITASRIGAKTVSSSTGGWLSATY
jgi:hypothetical protein